MAEIDLQRKRGGGWWPWLIGILAILFVVWALAEMLGGDDDPAAAGAADTTVTQPELVPPPEYAIPREYETREEARAAVPSTVQEYREACTQEGQEPADMGLQHEFTTECIDRLAGSVDAAIQSDTVGEVALDQRMEELRSNAERLRESDPTARTHAGIVAEAMSSAADLLETIRDERQPDDEELDRAVEEARSAAESISEEQPLLEQQDTVEQFFQAVGRALESVATDAERRGGEVGGEDGAEDGGEEVSAPAGP